MASLNEIAALCLSNEELHFCSFADTHAIKDDGCCGWWRVDISNTEYKARRSNAVKVSRNVERLTIQWASWHHTQGKWHSGLWFVIYPVHTAAGIQNKLLTIRCRPAWFDNTFINEVNCIGRRRKWSRYLVVTINEANNRQISTIATCRVFQSNRVFRCTPWICYPFQTGAIHRKYGSDGLVLLFGDNTWTTAKKTNASGFEVDEITAVIP